MTEFSIFGWAVPVNTHVGPVEVKPVAVACSFTEQSNQMFSSYYSIQFQCFYTDSKNVNKAKTTQWNERFQHSIQESWATNIQV